MYGKIDVYEWGFIPRKDREYDREYDAEENCRSDWFRLKTDEHLNSVAQENHPILLRIRDREREIERLASIPASQEDVPEEERRPTMLTLNSLLKEAIEEQGHDSEQVQKYKAAINWQENADEIKKLQEEYSGLYHSLFFRPFEFHWSAMHWQPTEEEIRSYNLKRQKYISAKNSLRWTIESAVANPQWGKWYEKWDKDYNFREDFEVFLSDIT